jgi:hypothetical protein
MFSMISSIDRSTFVGSDNVNTAKFPEPRIHVRLLHSGTTERALKIVVSRVYSVPEFR